MDFNAFDVYLWGILFYKDKFNFNCDWKKKRKEQTKKKRTKQMEQYVRTAGGGAGGRFWFLK